MGSKMIMKSALALLVTASFAGGAVYYGTMPTEPKTADTALVADDQTPPVNEPDEKYIDRFVKSDDEHPNDTPEQIAEPVEELSRDLDRLLDLEADVPDAPASLEIDVPPSLPTSSDVEMDVEVILISPTADGRQALPRIEIDTESETVTVTKIIETTMAKSRPSEEIIEMVLTQTEMIGAQELKDQAYLDIVEYAARHQNYDTALSVLGNIKQVELRDKARAQTAIAIAKGDDAQRAFSIIDEVEVEQLRDVLRLQVIEALMEPAVSSNAIKQ